MSSRITYSVEFLDPTGSTATRHGLTPEECLELVGTADKAHLATIVTMTQAREKGEEEVAP
jgi:hypothetical protein